MASPACVSRVRNDLLDHSPITAGTSSIAPIHRCWNMTTATIAAGAKKAANRCTSVPAPDDV